MVNSKSFLISFTPKSFSVFLGFNRRFPFASSTFRLVSYSINHQSYLMSLRFGQQLAFSRCLLPLALLFGLLHAVPVPTTLRPRHESGYTKTSSTAANVTFSSCPEKTLGQVNYLEINPCERSSPSDPCTFRHGMNYTVSLGFVSERNSSNPRSSVIAQDGNDSYAYSGQSFTACRYTPCPIIEEEQSTYTYQFHTLASPFNHLTFNVTDDFEGPSLFCAGTDIHFEP